MYRAGTLQQWVLKQRIGRLALYIQWIWIKRLVDQITKNNVYVNYIFIYLSCNAAMPSLWLQSLRFLAAPQYNGGKQIFACGTRVLFLKKSTHFSGWSTDPISVHSDYFKPKKLSLYEYFWQIILKIHSDAIFLKYYLSTVWALQTIFYSLPLCWDGSRNLRDRHL